MNFFILSIVLYVLACIFVLSFDYLSGDGKIYSVLENIVFPLLVAIFWPILSIILFVLCIIKIFSPNSPKKENT